MLLRLMILTVCVAITYSPAVLAKRINRSLQFGQDIQVRANKDVSLRAQCIRNENGEGSDVLRVYAATESNRTILDGLDEYLGNGIYLTPATLPVDSELLVVSNTTGVEMISNSLDEGVMLSLDSLRGLALSAESALLGLNVTGGESHDCLLSANVDKINKFRKRNH